MAKNVISRIRERITSDKKRFVSKNLDISMQVYNMLRKKGLTQKEFAKKLEKSESEVSKWLSGLHNLTLKSITKMEAVLEEDIILTVDKAKEKYDVVKYKVYITQRNFSKIENSSTEVGDQYLETKVLSKKQRNTLKIGAS